MAIKKGLDAGEKVGIAVGLTAAAVAAAGAYFLAGSKNAAKNRKVVKSWALKAKAEVLEGLENAKKMSEEEYRELLGTVSQAYMSAQKVSSKDMTDFKGEMLDHWKKIEKSFAPKKKAVKKEVKKTVKKVVKKIASVEKKIA